MTLDPARAHRLREIAGKPKPSNRARLEAAAERAQQAQQAPRTAHAAPTYVRTVESVPRCPACLGGAYRVLERGRQTGELGCVWCGSVTRDGVFVRQGPFADDAAPEVEIL